MAATSSTEDDPVRVFITTGMVEPDDYSRVLEYLESARGFRYKNLGDSPLDAAASPQSLRDGLRAAIGRAEIVIALAELDGKERDLCTFQLAFAQSAGKPVLLLPHFGSDKPLGKALLQLVSETSEWNQRSITDAIKRLARGEDTNRWETIEFKLD
jgi:hypothetical protein